MSSPDRKILSSQENFNVQDPSSDFDENGGGPPKAPRSAFMCFTDAKRTELMRAHDLKDKDDILKILAEEWRRLSHAERAFWDEEARNDKVRFVREKSEYKGPWMVPKRRAKKHPLAPKRPMSAFLKFSQKRRAMVKERNPDMSNTDVSRLLGEMWRNASAAERAPYVEQEERERAAYKAEIQKWREEQAKLDAANRTSHCEVVSEMEDDKQSIQSQQQLHSYDRMLEPSAYVTYEPLNTQPTDDHGAMRSHDQREVFRSYSTHHHSQPRPAEERDSRQEAHHSYLYRFNGPYHQEPYLRSYRQHHEPLSLNAEFDEVDHNSSSSSGRRHLTQASQIREDPAQAYGYHGRSRYFTTGSTTGMQHRYGYYHHH